MTAIAPARTSHVLENLNICESATRAGWLASNVLRPDLVFCGGAQLLLGNQYICVRIVVNDGVDTGPLLDALQRDVLQQSEYLETYIILAGYSLAAIKAYQSRFATIKSKRVTVGSPEAFIVWLRGRLGPLAKLPVSSPLRKLAEPFLCASGKPEPLEKRPLVGSYGKSAIRPSHELGQWGVQAFSTLVCHTRTLDSVVNVELSQKYQKIDVDLQIHDAGNDTGIATEVKCESPLTGNIALELWSRWAKKIYDAVKKEYRRVDLPAAEWTKGWLQYSEASCLITCLRHSGDVLMFDFEKLKQWVKTTRCDIPLLPCTAKTQNYYSRSHIVGIDDLLGELPDAIHLNISDWLPNLYRGEFSHASLVNAENQALKTLRPIRVDSPVA
jgi:hypothetical protein